MKPGSQSARPGRIWPDVFFLFAVITLALLCSVPGDAQQKRAAAPAAAAAELPNAPAQQSSAAAQDSQAAAAAPAAKKSAAGSAAQRTPQAGEEGTAAFREDNPGQRERWFYQQRAFPLGYIPFGIRQRAVEAREAMRARERALGIRPFASAARARTAGVAPAMPLAIAANALTWTPIGPQPTMYSATGVQTASGRVSALAVDPTDPNTVYAGGAQGGVWKSTDGGTNWTPLTDDQPSLAIGAISIAPTNRLTIYVGTGEMTNSIGSYYGAGILKSTDGGASWMQLPGNLTCAHAECMGQQPASFVGPHSSGFSPGGGARISSIAVDPTNENVLLAGVLILQTTNCGVSSGVYRSTNGGADWQNVLPGRPPSEVVFDPGNPLVAYAALGRVGGDSSLGPSCVPPTQTITNGVYKSSDGGVTWTKLAGGLPTANLGRIEIAIAPSAPLTLYASIADSSNGSDDLLGMFKTTNGGTSWSSLGAGAPFSGTASFCSPQCWYDHVLKVHPDDANVVYAGGAARTHFFTRSTNGGASFTPATSDATGDALHVDQHAIAFGLSGGMAVRMYVGNDGGVWSTDVSNPVGTIDWTNHNTTLNLTQFYPGLSIDPSTVDIGYGGTQDNGSQKYGGTLTWQRLQPCGDGGWTAIDPLTPTTVYVTCQNIDISKSLDSGANFSPVVAGINANDPVQFIPPLVMDPSQSSRLYFGTNKIYQTVNAAASWAAISPTFSGELTTIAIAPSSSAVAYAGLEDGSVQVSTNVASGSASWSSRSNGLPPRSVRQVAIDPADPMRAYVSFSGFSGADPIFTDNLGHLFRTTNAGTSWTDVSASPFSQTPLPNTPVNDVVIDPAIPGTLYVGTDVGVFATFDGGVNWQTLQSGLPNVAVLGLKLHTATRILRAATHGRGMWDLLLPAASSFQVTSLSPEAVTADPTGGAGFTLTVRGTGFTGSSAVLFNGAPLATTMTVAGSELQATVPGASLTLAKGVPIAVSDPDPAKGTSNGLALTVNNPIPVLSGLSPSSIMQGAGSFPLVINGTNFLGAVGGPPISEVRWNGSVRNSNAMLVSPTSISVTIPASDVTAQGQAAVTVANPTPGGGTSAAQTFSILGPDFSVGVNPATVTVTRGQTTSAITVTITPLNGIAFSSAVTLSCTGLPSQSTCVFNPASLTPGANPATAALTITTTAPGIVPPGPTAMRWTPPPVAVLALLLLVALLFSATFSAQRARRAPAWHAACLLLAIVILAGVSVSCGGGGGAPPPGPPPNPGTPTGTFTVTVRGTSGALAHTAALTLTVQ